MGLPSVYSLLLCLILPADAFLSDSEKWKHVETFFTEIQQQQSELKKVNTQLLETIENQIHVIKKLENRIAILESADCECRKLDKAKEIVFTTDFDSKLQKNYEETYVNVKNNRTDDVKQSSKGITVPIYSSTAASYKWYVCNTLSNKIVFLLHRCTHRVFRQGRSLDFLAYLK